MGANRDFLQSWLELIWLENDFAAASKAFTPQTTGSYVAGGLAMSPADYEVMVTAICAKFEPTQITLSNVMEQGPDIWAVLTISGLHRDTEQPIDYDIAVYRKIENGQFTASYSVADYLGLFVKLQQLPPDCMETLLIGSSLDG